jgi:hypothetical protein
VFTNVSDGRVTTFLLSALLGKSLLTLCCATWITPGAVVPRQAECAPYLHPHFEVIAALAVVQCGMYQPVKHRRSAKTESWINPSLRPFSMLGIGSCVDVLLWSNKSWSPPPDWPSRAVWANYSTVSVPKEKRSVKQDKRHRPYDRVLFSTQRDGAECSYETEPGASSHHCTMHEQDKHTQDKYIQSNERCYKFKAVAFLCVLLHKIILFFIIFIIFFFFCLALLRCH